MVEGTVGHTVDGGVRGGARWWGWAPTEKMRCSRSRQRDLRSPAVI